MEFSMQPAWSGGTGNTGCLPWTFPDVEPMNKSGSKNEPKEDVLEKETAKVMWFENLGQEAWRKRKKR
jgi:hypothetical protein